MAEQVHAERSRAPGRVRGDPAPARAASRPRGRPGAARAGQKEMGRLRAMGDGHRAATLDSPPRAGGNRQAQQILACRADGSACCAQCRRTKAAASALPVSAPGDRVERDASRTAERVLRTPAGAGPAAVPGAGDAHGAARAQPAAAAAPPAGAPGLVRDVVRSPGRPLDTGARRFMEPRFGRDLGDVRVHTDRRAAASAAAVDARAYTVGAHIAFADGEYAPTTTTGRRLLAHELAHVAQQGSQPRVLRTPAGQSPTSPGSSVLDPTGGQAQTGARVFVYDTDDPNLDPVWRAAAEHWAAAHDGLALESGTTGRETLERIADAYEAANADGRYACIRSIEFFGHGSPGSTLSGKFSASDAQTAAILDAARVGEQRRAHETMARIAARVSAATGGAHGPLSGPAQAFAAALRQVADDAEATARRQLRAEGNRAATGSLDSHIDLADHFSRVRGLLCSDSYLHMRTCESLQGASGELFGQSMAQLLDTHVIGHEVIIDTFLQEWRYFAPGGTEVAEVPEHVRPSALPLHALPRHLRVDIDLTGLSAPQEGFFARTGLWLAKQAHPRVALHAEVVARHDDPESHNLRVSFWGPELHVHLSEIARLLASQHSAAGISPTVDAMETDGRAIVVPINRTVIERFALNPAPLVFTIPTDIGEVTVSVAPTDAGPTWMERRGGLQLGVEPLLGGPFEQRPHARFPLADWRGGLRLSAEAAARVGPGAMAPEGGLVASMHILDTLYAYTSVYAGPGVGPGGPDLRLGLRSGVGLQFSGPAFEVTHDTPLRGDPSPVPLMFRLNWTFEGP